MRNRYSGYDKAQKALKKLGFLKMPLTSLLGYYHKDQQISSMGLEILQLLGLVTEEGDIAAHILPILAMTDIRPLNTVKVPRGGAKQFKRFYALRARIDSLNIEGLPSGPAAYFLLKLFQEGVPPYEALSGMGFQTGTKGIFKDKLMATGLVGHIPVNVWRSNSWVPSPRLRKYLTSENNPYFDREGDKYGYGTIVAHKNRLSPKEVFDRDQEWTTKYIKEELERLN